MKAVITRETYITDGTFGIMTLDGSFLCYTLERLWLNNKPQISCIPAGVYQCSRHSSLKFGNVWEVDNVPNRADILIHNGNTIEDSHGCILVGTYVAELNGMKALRNSRDALKQLMFLTKDLDNLELEIIDTN